jgi:hypothetical protein
MTQQNSGDKTAMPPSAPVTPSRVSASASFRPRQPSIPPPIMEELEEAYAARPEGASAPEDAIEGQLAEVEAWVRSNTGKMHVELTRFWLLRGVAFLGAVVAAAGSAVALPNLAMVSASLVALAVAMDAAWPSSSDRTALRRANRDLRELEHTLKLRWDKVRLAHPDPASAKRIAHALVLLDAIQAKREEIGKFLGDASPAISKRLGH